MRAASLLMPTKLQNGSRQHDDAAIERGIVI